jgi:CarD family transcriptional regulator
MYNLICQIYKDNYFPTGGPLRVDKGQWVIYHLINDGEAYSMFNIGDKVSYPLYGAGIIEAIEEKHILQQKKRYYVLKFAVGGMKVLVPVEAADVVGLRFILEKTECQKVMDLITKEHLNDDSLNWNRRYRENMDKLKTGNIFEVASVVKGLMRRHREKGLSSGEKRMMNQSLQILVSELSLSTGEDPGILRDKINDIV